MKTKTIILIFILFFVFLASCAGTDDAPENSRAEEPGQPRSEPEDTAGIAEFAPENADFGGYNFRIMGVEPAESFWIGATISEIYSEAQTGDLINDAVYIRNQKTEELYNISISLVPLGADRPDNGNFARRAVMAGDDIFDAALMVAVAIPALLAQPGNMADMNQIQTIDFSNSWWHQNAVSELSVANKLFIAIGDITLFSSMASSCLHMNRKLTQDFGLDNPYELVRAGKWTWDKVYDMNKRVTLDLDGDGAMTRHDQWGMFWEDRNIRTTILHSGERITRKDENDIPYLAVDQDSSANIVQAMIDTIFPREVTMEQTNSPLLAGTGSNHATYWVPKFLEGEALFSFAHFILGLNLRVMESDFAILPPPKLYETQEKYYSATHPWWATYLWIPTTNPDYDRTGTVLEALGYYSRQYITPAFIDTFAYKVSRDEDSAEMIELIINSQTHDIAYMYNWGDIFGIYDNSVLNWENRFASGFEAREALIRADMEKTINAILDIEQ